VDVIDFSIVICLWPDNYCGVWRQITEN